MGFFDFFREESRLGHTVCDAKGNTVARVNTDVVYEILDNAEYRKYFTINKFRNAYVYSPIDNKSIVFGTPGTIKLVIYPGYTISAVAENIM